VSNHNFYFGCFTVLLLICAGCAEIYSEDEYKIMREEMVQSQIVKRGVSDKKVIAAMEKVKRHFFVADRLQEKAYSDYPLSIGYGQTISQPYIVAYMSEALHLTGNEKVLEVGTGSGYQAAILAEIVKEVYTIEIIEELADQSRELLHDLGYKNIFVKYGDGYQGWKDHAPYDAIIVTAAPKEMPEQLILQLKIGGIMIVPIGDFHQALYVIEKTDDGYQKKKMLPVRFVPMIKGPSD